MDTWPKFFVDFLIPLQVSLIQHIQIPWEEVVPNNRVIYGDFIVPNADPKIYTEMDDILQHVPPCNYCAFLLETRFDTSYICQGSLTPSKVT